MNHNNIPEPVDIYPLVDVNAELHTMMKAFDERVFIVMDELRNKTQVINEHQVKLDNLRNISSQYVKDVRSLLDEITSLKKDRDVECMKLDSIEDDRCDYLQNESSFNGVD